MTTLYEAMTGNKWPKDLAYVINGERVTWAMIKANRIKHQRERLARVLTCDVPCRRACILWTFYVPGAFYSGWHLYLRTIEKSRWLRPRFATHDFDNQLTLELMKMFPCGLLPIGENFEAWKEAFAYTYPFRKKRGRKPQGIIFGWSQCTTNDPYPRNFQL